jgi:hypothetical protein
MTERLESAIRDNRTSPAWVCSAEQYRQAWARRDFALAGRITAGVAKSVVAAGVIDDVIGDGGIKTDERTRVAIAEAMLTGVAAEAPDLSSSERSFTRTQHACRVEIACVTAASTKAKAVADLHGSVVWGDVRPGGDGTGLDLGV